MPPDLKQFRSPVGSKGVIRERRLKIMKKWIGLTLAVVLCTGMLSACASSSGESTKQPESEAQTTAAAEKTEVLVYAAASLTESMDQIIAAYQKEHPDVIVTPNYGSSGTLVDQIKEGAPCDLFVSAAQKQMNQIDATADAEVNPDGYDCVIQGSRIDLLENKCVLAVTADNPAGLTSFDDLKAAFEKDGFIFAMGGESVPVGAYTQKIFAYLGLDESALANAGKITYGEDVKGVTTAISEGAAQAGVIYGSDAYSAGLESVAVATEEMTGGKVIYPAALINTGSSQEAAAEFLAYLQGEEAGSIFESVGFSVIAK